MKLVPQHQPTWPNLRHLLQQCKRYLLTPTKPPAETKATKMLAIDDLPYAHIHAKWLLHREPAWPTINQPQWCAAADATHLQPDEFIIGLYLAKKAYALPWRQMCTAHTANLMLADQPIMVSVCMDIGRAVAYHALWQGNRHSFHAVGRYCGGSIIADQETAKLWSPTTGSALTGDCRGNQLEQLPLVLCTWAEWRAMQPTTVVLANDVKLLKHIRLPNTPTTSPPFVQTLPHGLDTRLPHDTPVLGIARGDAACAYPLSVLSQTGMVLNQQLNGTELVIFHKPGSFHTLTFARRVGGDLLNFAQNAAGEIYDQNTGTRWNLMGEAIAGKLVGHQLTYLPASLEAWYSWAACHPYTTIFQYDLDDALCANAQPEDLRSA